MDVTKIQANLFEGEKIENIAGYPTLYRYLPVQPGHTMGDESINLPLVVFVPGAAHLARIVYGGHEGYQQNDFLSYWLNNAGYSVLAVSYPIEMYEPSAEIIPPTRPDFTVASWGEQVANTARKIMDEHNLSNKIILLSWSMGGRVLKPFVLAARQCKLDVQLYVSLAATPGGITGMRGALPKIHRTENGYAASSLFLESFPYQVNEMEKLEFQRRPERRPIFDRGTYLRNYVGHTPSRLGAWGLIYCKPDDENRGDTGFITNEWESLDAAGPTGDDFKLYPFIGSIRPTMVSDIRHVLADNATWGMILTYKLAADVMKVVGSNTPENDDWRELLQLVHSAPSEMTTEAVRGNHFFFIGESGARETCESFIRLHAKSVRIQKRITELLDKLKDHD